MRCKHHYAYKNVFARKRRPYYVMVSECIHCGRLHEVKITESEYYYYLAVMPENGEQS